MVRLAMTTHSCHCEEQSDVAIHTHPCHCEERSDVAIHTHPRHCEEQSDVAIYISGGAELKMDCFAFGSQ